MDQIDIKSLGLAATDALTNPEMFELLVSQQADCYDMGEAEMAGIMFACYSRGLWQDESLKAFLEDYIKDKMESVDV